MFHYDPLGYGFWSVGIIIPVSDRKNNAAHYEIRQFDNHNIFWYYFYRKWEIPLWTIVENGIISFLKTV